MAVLSNMTASADGPSPSPPLLFCYIEHNQLLTSTVFADVLWLVCCDVPYRQHMSSVVFSVNVARKIWLHPQNNIQKEDYMKHTSKFRIMVLAVVVVTTAIVAGCASTPPLRTEASTSGIRAAEEAGAAKIPQASLHLQLAKEELETARRLAARGEKEEAKSMLLRAEADGELAIVLSHKDAEKSEATAAVERVRQLLKDNQ